MRRHTAWGTAARQAAVLGVSTMMLAVAACSGSATSTGDEEETIAPLTRLDAPTAVTSTTTDEPSADTTTTAKGDDDIPAAARVRKPPAVEAEHGAREITTLPSLAPERTPGDSTYLEELGQAGINTTGVEDQLIGAAIEVCRLGTHGAAVTLQAVAGQLVAQKRTSLDGPAAASQLELAARTAYCATP